MAVAIGTYATLAGVKARVGATPAGDDGLIQGFCDSINLWIENQVGYPLAPVASATYVYDGFDALFHGQMLFVRQGVRAITLLEVAQQTNASFDVVPSTDYVIRPNPQQRRPGWPGTEIWIVDVLSATNPTAIFPPGFGNVRITMTTGWTAQPDDVVDGGLTIAVRAYQARRTGQSDVIGADDMGNPIISRTVSGEFKRLLDSVYRTEIAVG